MNKIVREHYPASKLPEDLRAGIDPDGRVTVTVIEERIGTDADTVRWVLQDIGRVQSPEQMYSPEEMRERIEEMHRDGRIKPVTIEEAVARIRALRDEWED